MVVAARGATQSMNTMSMSQPALSASDLRVALNTLLAEHIYLASSATRAALGGRSPEFQAAAGALDSNSDDRQSAGRGDREAVSGALRNALTRFGS
jgi:hypothetical protein